jgi:hypothetical protein
MPGLCRTLRATDSGAAAAAQLLLDLSWAWLGGQIDAALALPKPSSRDRRLDDLGKPLAAVLTTVSVLDTAALADTVTGQVRKQGDAVIALELSALRAAATSPEGGPPSGTGFAGLAADCAARLRSRLALAQRASDDWSMELPAGGCTCELCATLGAFLTNPRRQTFEWPLAKERRQHIHTRIDNAELPVTHVTRRLGRPFTLVLTKTDAFFSGEQSARAAAQTNLEWLTGRRPVC